jgi:hypothetical protein
MKVSVSPNKTKFDAAPSENVPALRFTGANSATASPIIEATP